MAGRAIGYLLRAEPRRAASGWALALDATVAVAAAAAAVIQVRHAHAVDVFVAPDGSLFGPPPLSAWTLAGAALTGLPLALRRLYPVTVWCLIIAAIISIRNAQVPATAFAAVIFAGYSAVVHSPRRQLAAAVVLVTAITVTAAFNNTLPPFPRRYTALIVLIPAIAAGFAVRELRRRLHDSATRLRRAEQDRDEAILRERARIASELHDVVTHNVSVMVVQAGAARKVLASSPGDAEDALLAVEATGRTAMAELRHLLGLLNPSGTGAPGSPAGELRPQPGLSQLGSLLDRVRATGLDVRLEVRGTPRPLPPGPDLTGYRVIQEALTNVMRHSGGKTTGVMIEWGELLVITVSDDGRGGGAGDAGRGLAGLRERLAVYGGSLTAGPVPGGGWRLSARMPA